MGFLGSAENAVDSKNRLMLPAKYRKSLTGNGVDAKDADVPVELIVTLSYDNEIRVYTPDDYGAYVQSLFAEKPKGKSTYDESESDDRRMYGIVKRNSTSVTFDHSGRIAIPAALLAKAEITKTALIEGSGDYLAIWDPARKDRFLDGEEVGGILNDLVAKRKKRLAAQAAAKAAEE